MKIKLSIETIIAGVLLIMAAGFIFSFYNQRKALEREIEDLNVKLAKATEEPEVMYIHDSIPVYKYNIVEVDKTDYASQLADKQLIKDLKLKIKEIEAENRTLLSTRDTVVLNPLNDSVFTYRDKWNRFSFELTSRVLDWEVRDSLTTYVSQEYRHHFLWWRWGKKGYKVTIVNHNPKSRIEYNKYIKVK